MHPVLEEFCRIPGLSACQPHSFNKFQRLLRSDVQPLLDEREKLLEENHKLHEQIRALEAKAGRKASAA